MCSAVSYLCATCAILRQRGARVHAMHGVSVQGSVTEFACTAVSTASTLPICSRLTAAVNIRCLSGTHATCTCKHSRRVSHEQVWGFAQGIVGAAG